MLALANYRRHHQASCRGPGGLVPAGITSLDPDLADGDGNTLTRDG